MFGTNLTTLDELRHARNPFGASLVFISDSELMKIIKEPVMPTICKERSIAELLCRMLDNPEKAREITNQLQDVCDVYEDVLMSRANKMLEYENRIMLDHHFEDQQLVDFCRELYDILPIGQYFGGLERIFRCRWSRVGFVPIEILDNKIPQINSVLVPFRFVENDGGVPVVRFQSLDGTLGETHEEWTRGIRDVATDNGIKGVDVVLEIASCSIGGSSYLLPCLMAWWNHQMKLRFPYNPLRVFATGELDNGRLQDVSVGIKRTKIRRDVAQSLLISPIENGEYGEIDGASVIGYDNIRDKIDEILSTCSADVFFKEERNLWSAPRIGERIVSIEEKHFDEVGERWIRFVRSAGGFVRNGRLEESSRELLGMICAMMNSRNGGVIIIGVERIHAEKMGYIVRPVEISEILPRGEDALSYYGERGWGVDDIAKAISDALSRNTTEERGRATWRIVDEFGKAEDLLENVRVVGAEFENRPIVALSVRPSSRPRAIRCTEMVASREIQRDYVCGGKSKNQEFSCGVWSIGELALEWPRPKRPDSLVFRDLLTREQHKFSNIQNSAYRDYEKIRRIMTHEMTLRAGYDYPPILGSGAEDHLVSVFSKHSCWKVASNDQALLRRIYAALALGYLSSHKCNERVITLPVIVTAKGASRSTNLLGCALNELRVVVPKLTIDYKEFAKAVMEGSLRLLLDLSALTENQMYDLDVHGTMRNTSRNPRAQLAVFGSSDLMMELELPIVPVDDLEIIVNSLFK